MRVLLKGPHGARPLAECRASGIELLNIRDGGRGGRQSPESVSKMVATRRANGSYRLTIEQRAQRSVERQGMGLGRRHTEETKRKCAEAEETKRKIGLAHKGNTWSLGRVQSAEERAKRSEITKQFWDKRKALGIKGALGS